MDKTYTHCGTQSNDSNEMRIDVSEPEQYSRDRDTHRHTDNSKVKMLIYWG